MMLKLKLGAASFIILGGLGFTHYDRAYNYVQVRVRADKVQKLCYGKESSLLSRTTRTTKEGDCRTLRQLVNSHPDFRGFTVYENTYVIFRYTSPVDNRKHTARIMQDKNLEGKPIRTYDLFDALVSNKNANTAIPL